MTAVRDAVWLALSGAEVVEVWTTERRNGRRVRRGVDVAHPVRTLQVNRGIWETAMRLAHGDAKRIRVHSATQVEVVTS